MHAWGAQPVPEGTRHREVLDAALALIAERGYAGASLRRLAHRLGMQQPSLYHYISSKKDLVEQIIATYSADMLNLGLSDVPERLDDFPQFIRDRVFEIYERPSHPLFFRAAVAVARVDPLAGALLREVFAERWMTLMKPLATRLIAGTRIPEQDILHLTRLVVNAIGFRLMEEKVLFDERPLGPDVQEFSDFVVDCARTVIRSLRSRARD